MKNIIILFILTLGLSCKAQSPIVAIDASRSQTPDGAYFKDLDNEFEKFEGVWVYTNGNTSLTIDLRKVEQRFIHRDYRDYIIGDYIYIENGVEIINTYPLLTSPLGENEISNIGGGYIAGNSAINEMPGCDDCAADERRIDMYIRDPERSYLSCGLVLRYMIGETNPEKMTIVIYQEHGTVSPGPPFYYVPRFPLGEFLMVKQ